MRATPATPSCNLLLDGLLVTAGRGQAFELMIGLDGFIAICGRRPHCRRTGSQAYGDAVVG